MKRIGKTTPQTRALLGSCIITLWILVFFALIQNITFETNDDNGMARMIYGMGTSYYDTHLVYINILAGKVMKLFLLLFPNVPWYPILQCALILISFFAVIYLFISKFGIKKSLFPTFLLAFFFVQEFLLKLQFSKTAGIAAIAGILLIFDAVAPDATGKIWKLVLGGLLTIAGSLYRFNAFLMILPPMLGIGICLVWKPLLRKDWKQILFICLPFVIVFGTCYLCRQYNTWVYQSNPTWAAYKEFNSLRSQLLDYGFPDYDTNLALYETLGICEADLSMFKSWDIADPEVFNVDVMRQLIAAKEPPAFSWRECIENVKHFFTGHPYSVVMLIVFCISLVTQKNKRFLLLLYAIFSIVFVQIYLYSSGRYGLNRIDAVLAFALFVIPILYCWGDIHFSNKFVAWVLVVALLITPFYNFQKKQPAAEKAPLYELMYSDPGHLYLRTLSVSTPLIPTAYDIYPMGYQKNYAALGGWTVYSVPFMEKMMAYGISNPFRHMINNPNVYFIATSGLESRLNYIRRHYHPNADAYLVKVTEDGYPIYRISTTFVPQIDVSQAIDGNNLENLHYSIRGEAYENKITFSGSIYVENENSFASSIYISFVDKQGNEKIRYATQLCNPGTEDLMNGRYGAFTREYPNLKPTDSIRLYLETESGLYRIDAGYVSDFVLPAPDAFFAKLTS